jgi:transcriptional regulator with XRE-family HTH domain
MTASTYGEILGQKAKAARLRADLGQDDLAVRMRSLGFSEWRFQTVGNVERGRRRLTAEELLGLALALETTLLHLLDLSEDGGRDDFVALPSGETVSSGFVTSLVYGLEAGSVTWTDNKPEFGPETRRMSPSTRMFGQMMRGLSSSRDTTIRVEDPSAGTAATFTWKGVTPPAGRGG